MIPDVCHAVGRAVDERDKRDRLLAQYSPKVHPPGALRSDSCHRHTVDALTRDAEEWANRIGIVSGSHMKWSVRIGLTVLTAALTLTGGGPAMAAGPEITRETIVAPSRVYGDCPGGTVMIRDLRVERTVKIWTDDTGVEIRESRHTSFTGTLVGPTGVEIFYDGHFNGRIDPQTGADTVTGLFRQARLPDGTRVVIAAGNDYINTITNDVDVAGNNTFATFNAQVCDALLAQV